MRKLLSGYLFRLIKSIDKWVLIFLYVLSMSYLIYTFVSSKSFVTMTRGNYTLPWGDHGEITISKDNVKDYKFESLGVSDFNLYRVYCEPIPKEDYDAIFANCGSIAYSERELFVGLIEFLHFVPAIIVLILIPDFFGTMFKDRTIKNQISCGYTKGQIYLSSLLFSFLLNLAMMLATLIIYVLLCLFYMWKPPVYLPQVLVMLLVQIMITFTLSSISLAVVFISEKRTAGFIVSFLLITAVVSVYVGKYNGGGSDAINRLDYETHDYYSIDNENWVEYKRVMQNEGPNAFVQRFDVSDFTYKTYYNGKELKLYEETYMNPVEKYARMAIIYMDPFVVTNFESFGLTTYMLYHDGIMAIELVNNLFWILVSTAAGMVVFKKKEVKG